MALVLCTGVDAMLTQTRKMILEGAGHTVITASYDLEVISACERHPFSVAVIGQATYPEMKRNIAGLVRQHCPSAKILELYAPHEGKTVLIADSWLEVPVKIAHELADHVAELISGNA